MYDAPGREQRRLQLEELLLQCCEPRVDEERLENLAGVADGLGFDEDELALLIRERLGITERRLRAHAVLRLSLAATPDEVKATHRKMAKALHPDRLSKVDPEARAT